MTNQSATTPPPIPTGANSPPPSQPPMEVVTIGGNTGYTYTTTALPALTQDQYSAVTLIIDMTASLYGYRSDILEMTKSAVTGIYDQTRSNPRDVPVMLRACTFDGSGNYPESCLQELHGYKPVKDIDIDDYDALIPDEPHGSATNARDATGSAYLALGEEADRLDSGQYVASGMIFLITDGADNHSSLSVDGLAALKKEIASKNVLDELSSFVIGVNEAGKNIRALESLCKDGGFDAFYASEDIKADGLSIGGVISTNIKSQSSSIGSGSNSTYAPSGTVSSPINAGNSNSNNSNATAL